jgi:GWxTD domain-containing protein
MRFFLVSLFVIALSLSASAQQQKLRVYLDTKKYYAPDIGNYIEIQFLYTGYLLKYKPVDGGLISELAVQVKLINGEEIVTNDAFKLESPVMKDSIIDDFYDIRRYALPEGDYSLELDFKDLNAPGESVSTALPLSISAVNEKPNLSDPVIIEYANRGGGNSIFFKSGYDIFPRMINYYPEELNTIPFYLEVYNSDAIDGGVFGVQVKMKKISLDKYDERFTQFYKLNTDKVVSVLKSININDLASGKYQLEFELIDKNFKVFDTKTYTFDRNKEMNVEFIAENIMLDPAFVTSIPKDSALFFAASLMPIASQQSQRQLIEMLKQNDPEAAISYMQSFWNFTAGNAAYDQWIQYKAQVMLVQKIYANNFLEGFESDRGRVYLQYGSPTNTVQREASPSEYPYEIWQYNKIGRFSNKRFIFYNPDLVNNAYRLLHSDMIGELKNQNWPQSLNSRNTSKGNVDNPNSGVQESFGGQSNTLFRQY